MEGLQTTVVFQIATVEPFHCPACSARFFEESIVHRNSIELLEENWLWSRQSLGQGHSARHASGWNFQFCPVCHNNAGLLSLVRPAVDSRNEKQMQGWRPRAVSRGNHETLLELWRCQCLFRSRTVWHPQAWLPRRMAKKCRTWNEQVEP